MYSFPDSTTENAPVAPKIPVPVSTVPVMFRISSLCHWPAPSSIPGVQFGKTFDLPVTSGQTLIFGDARSLSEIGRQERTRQLERGSLILGVTLLAWSGLSTPIYCRPAYFLQMDGG